MLGGARQEIRGREPRKPRGQARERIGRIRNYDRAQGKREREGRVPEEDTCGPA